MVNNVGNENKSDCRIMCNNENMKQWNMCEM